MRRFPIAAWSVLALSLAFSGAAQAGLHTECDIQSGFSTATTSASDRASESGKANCRTEGVQIRTLKEGGKGGALEVEVIWGNDRISGSYQLQGRKGGDVIATINQDKLYENEIPASQFVYAAELRIDANTHKPLGVQVNVARGVYANPHADVRTAPKYWTAVKVDRECTNSFNDGESISLPDAYFPRLPYQGR